jgi:putative DNA primase/helicase
MREDFFTYEPTFKLVFLGNHKPTIENLDEAMRRRFHLVPFTVKPKQIDRALADKLKTEWPAIFGWMIDGVLAWQQGGLAAPQAVLDATQQYFEDEDPVGRWIEDRCQVGEGETALLKSLFHDWEEWCLQAGEKRGSNKRFSQLIFARGFAKDRAPGTGLTSVSGISLKGAMDVTEATRLLAHL